MSSISSPGIGSGLDVNSIVTQLVALERQPVTDLQTKATAIQAQLSSYGLLQSYTSNVADIADKLSKPDFWTSTTATSSDAGSVAVSASANAAAGVYQVVVTQLAKAQALASKAFAASTTAPGSGTLHLQVGSWDSGLTTFTPDGAKPAVDIAIAAGDSLDTVRTKINAAKAGVTASIVNDASGARLVLTSTSTGAANAVRITTTDDDGVDTDAAGLSALAFDPPSAAGQMSRVQEAKNAAATINGLAVASASNTLSNLIDGVTLTLSKETTSAQVNVAQDTATLKKAVADFAKAFSDINTYISAQTKYDASTKKAGPLQGDRATLSVQSTLRGVFLDNGTASAVYSRLSAIGLEIQSDGSMKVNDAKLGAALAANPAEVAKLFAAAGTDGDTKSQGYAVRVKAVARQLIAANGAITTHSQSLRDGIKRNQKQQDVLSARVDLIQQRLTKQYASLDTLMSKTNATNSSLTQSLNALAAQSEAIAKGS
jgi:flagellar hook-associated protein 2